jgi:SPP1 gp7 family putative phage head morphogenesis protein
MRISNTLRRDPSGTKGLTRRYEGQLVYLFRNFKSAVVMFFNDGSRYLAEPIPVHELSTSTLLRVNGLIVTTIIAPGRKVTDDNSQKACATGAQKASLFLKQGGISAPPGLTYMDTNLVALIQQRNYAALDGITQEMGKKIANVLTDDIIKGIGADQMARDINAVVEIGIDRAKVLARTETMYAYNTVATERYKKFGISEVEWLATEDERTCDECGPLDGKRFPIGEMDCPLHVQCRCVTLPVIPEVS